MDQLLNIYANIERPSGNHSRGQREVQSSENIYENVFVHTLEVNRTGPALTGNKYMEVGSDGHSVFYKQEHTEQTFNSLHLGKMACVRNSNL